MLITVRVQGPGFYDEPTDMTIVFTTLRGISGVQRALYDMGWTVASQVSVIDHTKEKAA